MSITASDIAAKSAAITGPEGFFALQDVTVDGLSYRAYTHAPKTLIDVLQSGRNHGDIDFIVYEGERYSYSRFYQQVDALAASLQNDYGIAKGDRVALAMRNNPEWAIAYAAASLIGAIVVPINSWGKTEELRYAISDCGARVLICDSARLKLIDGVFAELDVDAIVVGDAVESRERLAAFPAVLEQGAAREYRVVEASPEDICLILYTSGSTGFPKGVAHRHIAITQSLWNMLYLGMLLMELEGAREFKGGAERETPLLTVPLFHATGLLGGFVMPLFTGQKAVMMYKWDSVTALKLIQDEKVTGLASVPAIVQDLLGHPEFDNYDTSSLIRVAAAGAATPAGLPELIQAKVGNPSRSAGYGMTESMAVCSSMSGAVFDMKPESAGVLSPIMDVRTVDADGNVLQRGQAGEIEMRGITCMQGYWEKPEANAATLAADGWMKTGDIGYLDDDNFMHITGRVKEIVIRGGENIYPGEIENVAYQHDAVHETVVFGVPDSAMGEELVMVCYLKPGSSLSVEELRDYMKERLAGYKVPKTIVFSEQPLPRNASEKLHKLKVREAFLQSA